MRDDQELQRGGEQVEERMDRLRVRIEERIRKLDARPSFIGKILRLWKNRL